MKLATIESGIIGNIPFALKKPSKGGFNDCGLKKINVDPYTPFSKMFLATSANFAPSEKARNPGVTSLK
jgi:hypothetical protein